MFSHDVTHFIEKFFLSRLQVLILDEIAFDLAKNESFFFALRKHARVIFHGCKNDVSDENL